MARALATMRAWNPDGSAALNARGIPVRNSQYG